LALAAWQTVAAGHAKSIMFRQQSPLAALGFGVEWPETRGINAALDDVHFPVITLDGWARTTLLLGRISFIDAFAQHLGHKIRDGNDCVALAQHEAAAELGTGALGHVPRQNYLGPHAGQLCRQDGRPDVAPMMAMDNLDLLAPNKFCRAGDET